MSQDAQSLVPPSDEFGEPRQPAVSAFGVCNFQGNAWRCVTIVDYTSFHSLPKLPLSILFPLDLGSIPKPHFVHVVFVDVCCDLIDNYSYE